MMIGIGMPRNSSSSERMVESFGGLSRQRVEAVQASRRLPP
jgi:hypothetical protein